MNQYCLICHEKISEPFGWQAIFTPAKEHYICQSCDGKFEKIAGEICRLCNRPFQLLDEKFRHGDLCNDCKRWEEDPIWKGYLDQNISLFLYNDFLKEVIAKYKFRGDYVLAKVFAEFIKPKMVDLQADLFVPIPLSEERLYERGFNQSDAIIREAGYQPSSLLSRIHSEKQSKKSRLDRIHFDQVFQLKNDLNLLGKKVILIDDIYTTGSTLRHAAKLLKEAGVATIKSLTIAR